MAPDQPAADRTRRVPWRPMLIVALGLLATSMLVYFSERAARLEEQIAFDSAVERARMSIAERIQAYIAMLRGGAALFAGTADVNRASFAAYVARLSIATDYPGVQGIGFTRRVAAEDLEAFVRDQRARGMPDFHVWPAHPREEYHSIVFLEPLDRRNLAAIGYDMFTEPVRRAAMVRARDTGKPAASRRVTLVQEIDPDKQAGFLIYVPVYAGTFIPGTTEERQRTLVGFVYSPFRVADLFDGIFGHEAEPTVGFDVLLGDAGGRHTLLHRVGAEDETPAILATRELNVAGETWTLRFWAPADAEPSSRRQLIALVMAGGVALSLLLAWLDTLGARHRRSAQQVTEYRHAIRSGERLHQMAMDNVSDHAIFRVDAAGRVASWNSGVQRLLGWPAHDFVGRAYSEVVRPDRGAGGSSVGDLSSPRVQEMSSEEGWFHSRDGSRIRCTVIATGLADEQEQFAGWLVVMRDVTARAVEDDRRRQLLDAERAARLEAERVGRMKDEFLATLSHELRTPLNAILGWAQVLARDTSNAAQVERGLEVIARNAKAQAQIVEDLLDMSRIVSGKIRLELEAVDVPAVVDAALDVVRPMAAAHGVKLRKHGGADLPRIAADPRRLQQALWNLLTNGVKFTPSGGEVSVSLYRSGDTLSIVVADTGQGITQEFLPHVFEPFRQADGSTTRRHGGLGLGLAIVKSVVEQHGGHVQAASGGPGHGSRFTLTLPLTDMRDAETPEGKGPLDGHRDAPLEGLRLLVVDDSPDGRELARITLEQAGASVTVTGSAIEALEVLKRDAPFDALVSDIAMPGVDGHQFVRTVRAMEGEKRRVPAIALTALVGEDRRTRIMAAGYDAYVTKPLDAEELIEVTMSLTTARRATLASSGGGAPQDASSDAPRS